MCGRFVQRYGWHEIQDLYELPAGPARNLQAHYNIAPTDPVEVVRLGADGQPSWSLCTGRLFHGGGTNLSSNCRRASTPESRSLLTSPCSVTRSNGIGASSQRAAITNGSKDRTGGSRISSARQTAGVLSFAGLWDRWKNPETGERCVVHDHRHGCQRVDAADSRPHAGGARQGGYPALAEGRSWRTASEASRACCVD